MYDNKKNSSRVFELYERLFELKQEDRFVLEFYGKLKGFINKLEMHQPAVTDAAILRGNRQDLAVSKVLFGLSLTLRSKLWGQILGGKCIPTLTVIFSRVMWVSFWSEVSYAPSIEQSTMISSRDRGRSCGRGRDFGGRGRGFVGGRRGSYGGRQSASEKDSRQCRHCGCSNHISEKCCEKIRRLKWAKLYDSRSSVPCGTPQSSSAIPGSFTVVLSQEEYDV